MDLRERYEGCLLGLAAGDALGTTLEFKAPGTFEPVSEIVGGGPFHLEPGQWTDDTAMALCLADSLVGCRGFDPRDQMERYLRWYRDGYLSCTGSCFDIGITTSAALERFAESGEPYAGTRSGAGNGCLMRLAPVPLAFARSPGRAVERAGLSARTTHGAPEAIDACRYFAGLIVGALEGRPKEELLADHFHPSGPDAWSAFPLVPRIAEVAAGSFRRKEPPEIEGAGYVVQALEAALWAFDRGADFADCVRLAVNLGDDADTTGAICGQIAGAYYGIEGIPRRWLDVLAMADDIGWLARRLHALAQEIAGAAK
jgi:ADP-ribosylglycohydrolase